MNTTVFNSGIPTEPDVNRLREAFGVPETGRLISYEEVEGVIGCKRSSNRFKTVLSRWRWRLFKDHNVLTIPERGKGVRRANNGERVVSSGDTFKQGLRKISRASTVADQTDSEGLTPEQIRVRDHVSKTGAALRLAAATAAKQLKTTN